MRSRSADARHTFAMTRSASSATALRSGVLWGEFVTPLAELFSRHMVRSVFDRVELILSVRSVSKILDSIIVRPPVAVSDLTRIRTQECFSYQTMRAPGSTANDDQSIALVAKRADDDLTGAKIFAATVVHDPIDRSDPAMITRLISGGGWDGKPVFCALHRPIIAGHHV